MKTDRVVIYASGHAMPINGKFVPGLSIDVGDLELDILVEQQSFDTEQECVDYLVNEMQSIVEDVCDRLGFDIVRCDLRYLASKERH